MFSYSSIADDTANYGSAIEDPPVGQKDFSMIYKLTQPYTVGLTAPKISLDFGTTGALEAGRDGDGDDNGCYVLPYFPKVNITISD